MPGLFDRIKDTTTFSGALTVGTSFTVANNPSPLYQSFRSRYTVSDANIPVAIVGQSSNVWQVCWCTYTATDTLRVDTIIASNNGDNAISTSGTSDVFVTASSRAVAAIREINTFTANNYFTGSNVGIGTTSPLGRLSVFGGITANFPDSNFPAIRTIIEHGGNAGGTAIIAQGANNSTAGSGVIRFLTPNSNSAGPSIDAAVTEKLRITHDGNVGIGTTTPGRKLSISGGGFAFDDAATTLRSVHWGNGTVYPLFISGDAASGFLSISTNTSGNTGVERMRIDSVGSLLIGTSNAAAASSGSRLWLAGELTFVNAGRSVMWNLYYGGSPANWRYVDTGFGWALRDDAAGRLQLVYAASGTANNVASVSTPVTFYQGLTGIGSQGYAITPDTTLTVQSPNIGGTAGGTSRTFRIANQGANAQLFDITHRRHTTGSDWVGTNLRLQRTIDVTPHAFIDFGIDGVSASTGLGFGSGSTTTMALTAAGDLGIGTTLPSYKLHVVGAVRAEGTVQVRIGSSSFNEIVASGSAGSSGYFATYNSSATRIGFNGWWDGNAYYGAWTDTATPIIFGTAGNTRLTIRGDFTGSFGDAITFTKVRNATGAFRYTFSDAGGLESDANGGSFWRGVHFESPAISVSGSPVFPRLSITSNFNTLTNPTTKYWALYSGNDAGQMSMAFFTNDLIRLWIANTGQVGVLTVTPNPSSALDVNGSIYRQGSPALYGSSGNDPYVNARVIQNLSATLQDGLYVNYNSTGGAAATIKFYVDGITERARIDSNGFYVGSTGGDYGRTWRGLFRRDHNAATEVGIINATVGASATAKLVFVGGTANSFTDWDLFDNNGNPYFAYSFGGAVQSLRWALGGAERLRLTSSGDLYFSNDHPGPTSTTSIGYMGAPVNNQTTTYTLVLTDAGKTVRKTGTTAFTVTIPADGTTNFPIGTCIILCNAEPSAGALNVTGATGVTMYTYTSSRQARAAGVLSPIAFGGSATIRKIAANAWAMSGAGVS